MMKIAAAIGLLIVLIFVSTRVYSFFVQERQLDVQLADIQASLTKSQTDEADLQNEVQYLANPLNLEKELRARFNYKNPGETMIIIVPAQSSTASSSGSE
jgi:cell division protein FtsB